MSHNRVIITDLDGTIALDAGRAKECLHSGKRDWDAYYDRCSEDKPNDHIIQLLNSFANDIWILSGRVNRTRNITEAWLTAYGLQYDHLVMRADEDRTDDYTLKLKWAQSFGFTPEKVWFILEDRDRVVEAWRAAGYTCLQVARGEF